MSEKNIYENWFLIHSGLKKPEVHAPTKGGFLIAVSLELKRVCENNLVKKTKRRKRNHKI